MKRAVVMLLKLIALAILLTVTFVFAARITGLGEEPAGPRPSEGVPMSSAGIDAQPPVTAPDAEDASKILGLLLVVSFLETSVFAYFIVRSQWSGWKLVGAVFVAFYGLYTVVAQIESAVYLPHQLPRGMVPRLFVLGLIVAAVFAPAAVLLLGKARKTLDGGSSPRLKMSRAEWIAKLVFIMVAYLVLYFVFGYFVAWKVPEVRAYYRGTDPGSFFAQLGQVWKTTHWMFPFQMMRAVLWVMFALPMIRMLTIAPWKISLAVACLFAVWSAQLILPNPYMPAAVARAHLIETATSNFIFGALVGWLFGIAHGSVRGVFRTPAASGAAA